MSETEHASLDRLARFIVEMNSTNSNIDKSETLKRWAGDEYVMKILYYVYNDFITFGITGKKANAHLHDRYQVKEFDSIFDLLDELRNRSLTGHAALNAYCEFALSHIEHRQMIYDILDRNLGIRIGVTEINKAKPGFIPVYDCVLAKKYCEVCKKINYVKDTWFGSRKMDGVRCQVLVDWVGDVVAKSRTGLPFHTLQVLIDEVKKMNLRGVVFDGEVCLINAAGMEDFSGIQKVYNKKNYTIPNPKYVMFDFINYDDFIAGKGDKIFSERLLELQEAMKLNPGSKVMSVLAQGRIRDDEHRKALLEIASKNGWEGIMMRKDVGYVGKRTPDLVKNKEMHDAEYKILGVDNDEVKFVKLMETVTMREVLWEDGEYIYADDFKCVDVSLRDEIKTTGASELMVSNLMIEHRGNPVGVGSGLTIKERREWFKNPSLIIGKEATIQYFQETCTDGKYSLRFPVLKAYYEGKRDM